jgi:lipopolysaccharide export system protein LptC
MSELAASERRKKQDWAAPGSFHDRLMSALKLGLPAIIGLLLAYLAMAPLTRSQEISFVLDKNHVEVARERMKLQSAQYRGSDDRGRPFILSAASAVQATSRDPIVNIERVWARISMDDGPAAFAAQKGQYNLETQQVAVIGPIAVRAPGNYRLSTRDVTVDLNGRTLQSNGEVQGTMRLGTFSADRLRADIGQHSVTLQGNARLHIIQGGLR